MSQEQTSRQPRKKIDADKNKKSVAIPRSLFTAAVCIFVVLVSVLAAVAYWRVTQHSARISFFITSLLSLLVLAVIVVQTYYYVRQWNTMEGSLERTDKVIEKMQAQLNLTREQTGVMQNSLTETQKMAGHSERSVQIAEQSMEYAQRAYVTINRKAFTGTGFAVDVENSGNTPAREVMVSWVIDAKDEPPKMREVGDSEGDFPTTIFLGLLAPRSPEAVFIPCNRTLTAEEDESYREWPEVFHWWIVGRIFYRDIFQGSSPADYRMTDFCLFYDQEAQAVRAHYGGNEDREGREGKDM